jgi:tetratricopeptide (TPR) repeat protein
MSNTRHTVIHRVCTLALVAVTLCGQAHAQTEPAPLPRAAGEEAPAPAPDSPTRRAEALFAEGAELFKQWRFDEAEQRFREALAHREHPLIVLYLSRTLDKQHRLVEAHTMLMQALRRDRALLPLEDVQVADDLQASLESRLAQIEVSCDVPGAEVSLDGEPWFTAPGWQRRVMRAGQHVLVARARGHFPITEAVSLIPGKRARVALRMTADVVHEDRRWRAWQPWSVTGAGVAVSIAGGLLWREARQEYAEYETAVAACNQRTSCAQVPNRLRDTGQRNDALGTAALLTGGAVLVTGLAGVLMNQPRTRRSEPTGRELELELAPLVSGDAAGLSARLSF